MATLADLLRESIRLKLAERGVRQMHEIEVHLVVDGDGSFAVGETREQAWELFTENGLHHDSVGIRVLKLKVGVTLPTATVLNGTAPANASAATMVVTNGDEPIDLRDLTEGD